jgi:predicted PurR-regulated permease PerM
VLLWAIIQLSTLIVPAPVIICVFSTAAAVPAVIFLIWSLVVSLSDHVLKPLLLGRGLDRLCPSDRTDLCVAPFLHLTNLIQDFKTFENILDNTFQVMHLLI